ncbi:Pectin lyase fold/virulence factor [Apiospora rasikravindrae]|uniref:Pectin lyase fold/virulence factor n=1 Tax=Apiospora rasikravindrae TaxID=990691 RepID=A0ABR1S0X5_9PEZI
MNSIRRLVVSLVLLLNSASAALARTNEQWASLESSFHIDSFPLAFQQPPPSSPEYMVDNTGNKKGVAPNKGKYNGPAWQKSGSFEGYIKKLSEKKAAGLLTSSTTVGAPLDGNSSSRLGSRQSGSFWLPSLGPLGKAPHAGDGYVFYRNVLDYGADNTGATSTEEAINAAIVDGGRCGEECGNTFVLGALIYFPPGTYKICTPIIQYYLTQFVGDPHDRPIIKGCDEFTGIALIDVDPYVPNQAQPDGSGVNWYINQNQFFRQIRNFVFDMVDMPAATDEHDQKLVPTGIHWQVSQACSLQNLLFRNCITAVQMVWDWGFNWHKVDIDGGSIAFNISGRGGLDGQGIGSVSIIDSTISNVPIGVLTNDHDGMPPNIVLDNTAFNSVGAIVIVEGGETLLEGGTTTVDLWAHGRRYISGQGERATGHIQNRPAKPEPLLDGSGKLFTRLRPQYEDLPTSSFLIATEHGCSNDGTGDNTAAINSFLQQAAGAGQVAFFPAGIYSVQGTVTFPTGSKVVVRVGEEGDVGSMEIVDMLFTAKGPTAGAIMMEWNVHESSQGTAALWDSHIRVGGGIGTDLDVATCPKFSHNDACICVSMLLHITKQASGYFENFWAWVADHDNDMSLYWELDSSKSQISLFGARGVLVESQGPVWIYGSGSEHVLFYQYEMLEAKNVYLGHIQTESPYMQPHPVSPSPMEKAIGAFPGDPDWSECTKETCEMAWGLRILDSEGVMLHSVGLYSWFNDYDQACLASEDCQQKVMEVRGSRNVSLFNIFSKAVEEIGTATSGNSSIQLADDNQQGYTSEISCWFPEDEDPSSDLEVVYIGTEVYSKPTAACHSPCVLVLAPSPLASTTTIIPGVYTTSLEVGKTTTTVTVTPKPITADEISFYNVNVTGVITDGVDLATRTSMTVEVVTVTLTYINRGGQTTTSERELQLPPWPQITDGPPENWNVTTTGGGGTSGGGGTTTLEPWPEYPWPPEKPTTTLPPGTDDPESTEFPVIYMDPIFDDIDPECDNNGCPPDKEDDDDDDHGAFVWVRIPVEMFTRSYGLSVSNGVTVTATTRTITETAYDTGCPTPEWTTTAACMIRAQQRTASMPKQTQAPAPSVAPGALLNSTGAAPRLRARNEEEWQHDNDCPDDEKDTIIYMVDDYEQEDAEQVYDRLLYDEEQFGIRSQFFQMAESTLPILFVHVWSMPKSLREKVAQMAGVAVVRGYRGPETPQSPGASAAQRDSRIEGWKEAPANGTSGLVARAEAEPFRDNHIWWRSQISSYPGEEWVYEGTDGGDEGSLLYYEYFHDDKLGEGQVVYIIEEDVNISDPEFAGADIEFLTDDTGISRHEPSDDHGTLVAKMLVGQTIGLVPKATMVAFDQFSLYQKDDPTEKFLIALLKIITEVEVRKAQGKCVINMSFVIGKAGREYFGREMLKLLTYLEVELDCVLVAAAGNTKKDFPNRKTDDSYPQFFKYSGDLPNLLIAGASSHSAYRSKASLIWSNGRDDDMVYAPGLRMSIPVSGGGSRKLTTGTSISAPLTAGVVAYLRSLDSKWKEDLETPDNVVKMVKHLTRKVHVVAEAEEISDPSEDPNVQPKVIWNGHAKKENCLLEYSSDLAREVCDDYVQDIPDSLSDWNPVDDRGYTVANLHHPLRHPVQGLLVRAEPDGHAARLWRPSQPAHVHISPPGPTTMPPLPGPPSSTCASYTPTRVCNGSGGRSVCITSSACATATTTLPPLETNGPYSGPGCATYTSTTVCNGSGGRSACITDKICMVTPPPCPAYPTVGKPVCDDPDFPLCLLPTTVVKCAFLPTGAAAIDAARVPSTPTATIQPPAVTGAPGRFRRQQRRQDRPVAQDSATGDHASMASEAVGASSNNATGAAAHSELLGIRQDVAIGCGGPGSGGCAVTNICASGFCAKVEKMSCVQAFAHINMWAVNSEMVLDIFEDGEQVCSWSVKCLTVDTPDCLQDRAKGSVDCKGGGKIAAWTNGLSLVRYDSPKYGGRSYNLYLGQDGDTQWSVCPVTIRLWALCADSDWSASEGLCSSSSAMLGAPPRRRQLDGPVAWPKM